MVKKLSKKKKIIKENNIKEQSNYWSFFVSLMIALMVIIGNSVLIIPYSIWRILKQVYSLIKSLFINIVTFLRIKKFNFKFKFDFPKFPTLPSLPEFPKLPTIKIPEVKLAIPQITQIDKVVNATKFEKRKLIKLPFVFDKLLIFFYGLLFSIIFIFTPYVIISWLRELPNPDLISESVIKCTKILDRKERLMYEICPEQVSEPIKLSDIPPVMVNATLAIEDSNFYLHKGFNLISILRAAKETLFNENVQGGSTITQQLVKLSLLSPERTIQRKLKELILSIVTESKFSKEEILEMYFNLAPYGGSTVGIESASQRFFGKTTSDLNLSEASLLAGLPTAPSIYSPYTAFDLAKDRQRLVLNRMTALGYITREEAEEAFNAEITIQPQIDYIRAPHFVDYVRSELEATYGKKYANFGGLTVKTSLDLDIQDEVQKIVKEEVEKNRYLNVSNGAAIVLDSRSGQILAMVGSTDYFNAANDGVFNASIAQRLPGSTIKVVTYSLALTKGYKTTSIIEDSPISIKSGTSTYTPVNYDGRFHGKVTFRAALANSYNIPAVKILRSLNVDDMVRLGNKMGLRNWEADGNYGLAITLGGKETRLLDLTNVYATLARGGVYTNTKPFLEIRDSKGYVIYFDENIKERALSEEVSYIMTDILADYNARLPAFGVNNFLSISGHRVAVKTGTTDQKRDNYTVGYTPTYTVGVWVGNNDNAPMNPNLASGLTGAAPAWNRIMTFVLKDTANESFQIPSGIESRTYAECSNLREVFVKGTAPKEMNCKVNDDDKQGEDKDD